MSIYVNFEVPEDMTIHEFLKKFYDGGRSKSTYEDKECTRTQCYSAKNRSSNDLYELVTTYFPETDLKTFIHEILCLKSNCEYVTHLYQMYCINIYKFVMQYSSDHFDFYGSAYTKAYGDSPFSWKNLVALLGITNYEEYCKYIKENQYD